MFSDESSFPLQILGHVLYYHFAHPIDDWLLSAIEVRISCKLSNSLRLLQQVVSNHNAQHQEWSKRSQAVRQNWNTRSRSGGNVVNTLHVNLCINVKKIRVMYLRSDLRRKHVTVRTNCKRKCGLAYCRYHSWVLFSRFKWCSEMLKALEDFLRISSEKG